ncbi:MAG: NAD(P)/FAD-dependent oxidoreductase [Nitrospirales bacterium]|nr:NAD(P)/FAD-dependent oxidoreductase [Nitrospira sp.]MDR4502873.1 NAD(P)/FAD-dependent oxidoreductase [Nitrospirales bacterium]
MPCRYDLAIIGAGAAGLAAAIFSAETQPGLKVVLVDSAKSLGAKILVSGGGRCNVTNATVTPKDFHAPSRIVERILKRFDEHRTVQWFESMDVSLKQEPTGKIFPVMNKARTVLNALLSRCGALGVQIKTNHRVHSVIKRSQCFAVQTTCGVITARRVIMATGGKSLPKTGSDGSGWDIVRQLGHTVTACYPALVPLVLSDIFFHKTLSGISHQCAVTTRVQNRVIDRRSGSLLWTHFGVSGPVVMDASRFWVKAHQAGDGPVLSISFFPEHTFAEVEQWLLPKSRSKNLASHLSTHLPHRVAVTLDEYVADQIAPHSTISDRSKVTGFPLNELSRQTRRTISHALTDLTLPVVDSRGWNHAEVTAGGVPLSEINVSTMESRRQPGLYLIGEILDCDGRIGGFNFQWAWSTGHIAGCHAAKMIEASSTIET